MSGAFRGCHFDLRRSSAQRSQKAQKNPGSKIDPGLKIQRVRPQRTDPLSFDLGPDELAANRNETKQGQTEERN